MSAPRQRSPDKPPPLVIIGDGFRAYASTTGLAIEAGGERHVLSWFDVVQLEYRWREVKNASDVLLAATDAAEIMELGEGFERMGFDTAGAAIAALKQERPASAATRARRIT